MIEAGGGLVYAMIIASVTSIVQTMDSNTKLVQQELDSISSYCRIANFPKKLGKRVRRYFRHYYASKSAIDQGEFRLAGVWDTVSVCRIRIRFKLSYPTSTCNGRRDPQEVVA